MSNLRALCCLPSVKNQKHDFSIFCSVHNYKIVIRFGSVISRIIKVKVGLSASALGFK